MTDPTPRSSTVVMTQAQRMAPRTLTVAELRADAAALFGNDPMDWAFECPHCGDVATGTDFRTALDAHPRSDEGRDLTPYDLTGQECIGRTLAGGGDAELPAPERGCNWAAYGLFKAPWTVLLPDGRTMHAFPLAVEA